MLLKNVAEKKKNRLMKRQFRPPETIGRPHKPGVSRVGFTLVEMMIVVAIIIILITLAVPNMLRSRIIANEGVAIGALRTINNACQLYHINKENYPASLSDLIEPASNPPYIDDDLADGYKQGYDFIYNRSEEGFSVNANPTGIFLKGRYFYTDESGLIRAKTGSPAGPDDEIIG